MRCDAVGWIRANGLGCIRSGAARVCSTSARFTVRRRRVMNRLYTNALSPVIAWPMMSVWMSSAPS